MVSRQWALCIILQALLTNTSFAEMTCDALKTHYKESSCCGNPSKVISSPPVKDTVEFHFAAKRSRMAEARDLAERSSRGDFLTYQEARDYVPLACTPGTVKGIVEGAGGTISQELLSGHHMMVNATLTAAQKLFPHVQDGYWEERFSSHQHTVGVSTANASDALQRCVYVLPVEKLPQNVKPQYDLHEKMPESSVITGTNGSLHWLYNGRELSCADLFGNGHDGNTVRNLKQRYGVNSGGGNNPVIALMELNQTYSRADLNCYQEMVGARDVTIENIAFAKDSILPGEAASCAGDINTCGVEAALDIQIAATMSQDAKIQYILTEDFQGFIQYFHSLHTEQHELPTVLSTSYSMPEQDELKELAIVLCDEFYTLAIAGVTTFVASGDWGASGTGEFGGLINDFTPSFPQTCPWVTTVGGTYAEVVGCTDCEIAAMADGNQRNADLTNSPVNRITSSGSFSNIFTAEAGYNLSFQTSAVRAYLEENLPPAMLAGMPATPPRAYPDISASATAYPIFAQGQPHIVDGTSAAAPLMAAIVSQAYQGTKFGWINPRIYEAYHRGGYFWDVTVGDNYWGELSGTALQAKRSTAGFNASVGWDPVTGVGSLGSSAAGGAQRFVQVLQSGF